jgi:hypothetical protein
MMFTFEGVVADLMTFGVAGIIFGWVISCARFVQNTFLALSLIYIPMFFAVALVFPQ